MSLFFFFFVKQKTAYEMRISDWSSDVCSSDPNRDGQLAAPDEGLGEQRLEGLPWAMGITMNRRAVIVTLFYDRDPDRRSLVDRFQYIGPRDQIGRASCRERVCQYV